MEGSNKVCVICKGAIIADEGICTIRKKGATGINKTSREKGDDLFVESRDTVHIECRKNYLRDGNRSNTSNCETNCNRGTRSSTGGFDFRSHCSLCGLKIKDWEKRAKMHSNVSCKYREVDKSIYKAIDERGPGDEWAIEIKGRLEVINDLRSEDAIYHNSCSTKFRVGHPKLTTKNSANQKKHGRPVEISRD